MKIGVPKEIKPQEFRVGLTPEAVKEYISHGHTVIVESQAGMGIGATDEEYQQAGAEIISTADEVFDAATMIVKVKEPQAIELKRLKDNHILYTYLHLASDRDQTNGLIESGCTAIAYETVTDGTGALPLLAPMSEVAGKLSIQAAAHSMEKHNGGSGLLMGGVPGVKSAHVCVIGGGVVGTNAAKVALGMGATVTMLDMSIPRLRQLDDLFGGAVQTLFSSRDALEQELARADVLIGAVLIPGAAAPKLLKKSDLGLMKPGAVLVDVAIDQGGCFETSKATTHAEPTYVVDDIVHYCVANMPGAVARTSSYALNIATLRHGLSLANNGHSALADPFLLEGLNVHDGKVTYEPVAESLGIQFHDPRSVGFVAN